MLAATWSLRPDGHTLDSYKEYLQTMVKDLGYIHTDLMLYYKIPKLPLHNGLKSLACDKDVMEMCQYVSRYNNTCKNKPSESNPAKGPSESNPAKRACESNADSDDSDFDIGDEDIIGDVDVDMDDFRKHTDENVEWTECTEKEQVPPPFDYEEVDLEEFGSGTESDDPECERKRALKKLAKAHRPVDGLVYSDNFYIGNDKTRMTAECRGKVPVFNDGGSVCKESGPLENKPKGDSVKCNKKSKKKGQVGESIKCPWAKQMAEEKLFGDWAKQYAQLRQYALELKEKNPETTIKIDVERCFDVESQTRQFRRIYICLGALKNGFKAGKRDLLGLDGCFLSGPYPGQILTAVGVDPNNGIYPLAYAVVEGETKESWLWFLDCLGDDLELFRNSNFTFISDRQKKLQWRGEQYKDLLWRSATATTVQRFGKNMEEIKKLNPEMYNWLKDIPPQHWARSHFSGRPHCGCSMNNMCEVIVIVQGIIDKSTGPLTPNATKLFNLIKRDAAQYKVIWNGADLYDITGPYGDKCVVNIRLRSCAVEMGNHWHACNMQLLHLEMANNELRPESDTPITLTAPNYKPPIGRPKKKRRKSAAEIYDNLVKRGKLSRAGGTNGFKAGKRDLLGLDGCFLSGPYPGQILTAVGVDPNNGIYPLAYAVVEGETKESWLWFLDCLGDDLELFRNSNFTFISDRQKGLIPALQETFPAAEHRYCLKHIYDNMKLQWRGEQYKDLLWRSATATTVQRPRSVPKSILEWYGYASVADYHADADYVPKKKVKSPGPIAVLGLPNKVTWMDMVKKMGIRGAGITGKGKGKV
ncbi:mutator type transposase [Tanacetum coccineum]